MARFKYWLQADESLPYVQLTDEPQGMDGISVILERDSKLRGLFYNFMAGLIFWGEGYEIIKNKLLTDGPCGYINFRLEVQEYDYGSYDLLYKGRIPLSNDQCTLNITECTATCKVEDENFSALVMKYKDAEITIGKEITISGESQPNINSICDFHNVDTGTYDWTGRTVYFVKDALDYIVRYLTDNELTVSSTYLTAGNFQPYIVEVHLQNGVSAAGALVDIYWTDDYGRIQPPLQVIAGPATPSTCYHQALRQTTLISGEVDGQNYMDGYFINGAATDCAGTPVATKFLLYGWTKDMNVTRVHVTPGVGVPYDAILTECQPFEYTGAYPFVIANMRRVITDPARPVITTFTELMQTLTACFGVAFRFTNNGSGPVMQVEQINDFFVDSEAINLSGVNGIEVKPTGQLIYNGADIGEQNYAEELMFRPETWVNPFCLGDKLEGQRPYAATARYSANDQQDQNIIVHVEPNGGDWKTVQHREQSFAGGTTVDRFWFNAPLIHLNCLYKNEYLFSGNLKKDGLTYTKSTDNPTLPLKYEFEHQLSCSQIRALINNPVNFVAFDGKKGYIEKVEIDIVKRIGKFVLLSELNL